MTKEELLRDAKPILFNTDMVKAILEGRKTVTRRICKDGNDYTVPDMGFYDADKRTYAVHNYADAEHTDKLSIAERKCPICPGDILYVRETWQEWTGGYVYKAWHEPFHQAGTFSNMNWKPSIHMPKEAARIFLKVSGVRVERLQDITEEQAKAEGICEEWAMAWWKPTYSDPDSGGYPKYRDTFAYDLWDSTIKKSDINTYGWNASPWVWVIEFERIELESEE